VCSWCYQDSVKRVRKITEKNYKTLLSLYTRTGSRGIEYRFSALPIRYYRTLVSVLFIYVDSILFARRSGHRLCCPRPKSVPLGAPLVSWVPCPVVRRVSHEVPTKLRNGRTRRRVRTVVVVTIAAKLTATHVTVVMPGTDGDYETKPQRRNERARHGRVNPRSRTRRHSRERAGGRELGNIYYVRRTTRDDNIRATARATITATPISANPDLPGYHVLRTSNAFV